VEVETGFGAGVVVGREVAEWSIVGAWVGQAGTVVIMTEGGGVQF
jgi:hypothetical protein